MIVKNSIEVVLPLPIDKTFSYAVTREEFDNILNGSRVVVNFGKKKFYTAVVFSKFLDKNYDYELKEIEYIIDYKPCVNDYQIKFFSWIADYYMCPIGKVLETALPKLFLRAVPLDLLPKREILIDPTLESNFQTMHH